MFHADKGARDAVDGAFLRARLGTVCREVEYWEKGDMRKRTFVGATAHAWTRGEQRVSRVVRVKRVLLYSVRISTSVVYSC